MTRGRFITLEGGEGVGKSTQARALGTALRTRGIDLVETREPGGSAGAEAIRSLLFERDWDDGPEALLFAAARGDHVARTIAPALAAGRWVLCDRFVDSSRAYQGMASGLGLDRIAALHETGSGGLLPDLTLLLTAPPEAIATRLKARDDGRADRFDARGANYHRRVADGFQALAAAEPARFRIIDALGEPTAVTNRLLAAIDGAFA
ncbi:dTMP kinase [Sphingomonas sp. 1P06PA]|uniref:dTMP kinase n=1 Tax=Sphingomonas sp. 1P06PA TaxID=554121 RepID=UPI0039A65901